MAKRRALAVAAAIWAIAGPGGAAWAGDYCPDRPGLDTPPCTMQQGHLSVETSLADWTHTSDDASVTDGLLLGDLALRYGIGARTEARFAWSPYGRIRTRDRVTGQVSTISGSGDVTLGIKQNILDPGGEHISIALLPSVTLATGGDALGAGTWSAGLQVPVGIAAGKGLTLMLTPAVNAAANASGQGRHFAYGTAGGIGYAPAPGVNLAAEVSVMRDDDPAGASTNAIAGVSGGVMLSSNLQIDLGAGFGLNRDSPDRRITFGLSRRF